MIDLGNIYAVLGIDITGFVGGLADAQKGLFRFVHIAEGITDSLFDIAKGAVAAGLETSQALEVAEIAIGNMAETTEEAAAFIQDLRKFAEQTPFAFEKMTGEVRKLQGAGIELEDMIPILTIFGDQVSAMGTGADGLKHLVKAFTDMKGAGKVMASDMTQIVNSGIGGWQLLADHLGVTVQEARKKVSKEFISAKGFWEFLLKDMMATTGGQMSKMAMTLGGMWEAFTDHAKLALADGLVPLRDQLKGLIPILGDTMHAGAGLFTFLVDSAADAVKWIAAILAAFNALTPAQQDVVVWTLAMAAALVALGVALAGVAFVASTVASALVAVGTIISFIGLPVALLLVSALGTLAAALGIVALEAATFAIMWANNWYGIRDILLDVAADIGAAWNLLTETMTEAFNKFVKNLVTELIPLAEHIDTITAAAAGMARSMGFGVTAMGIEALGDSVSGVADKLKQLEKDFKKPMFTWDEDIQDYVVTGETAISKLADFRDELHKSMTEGMSSATDDMAKTFDYFMNGPLADMFNSMMPEDAKKALQDYLLGFNKLSGDSAKILDDWLKKFLDKWTEGASGGGKGPSEAELKKLAKEREEAMQQALKNFWDASLVDYKQSLDGQLQKIINDTDTFHRGFDKVLKDTIKMWDNAIAKQEAENKQLKQDTVLDAVGGAVPQVQAFSASIKAFSAAFGPIGVMIGIIVTIISQLEIFSYFLEKMGEVDKKIFGNFDDMFEGLYQIVDIIAEIASVAADFDKSMNQFGGIIQGLDALFDGVGAVMEIFLSVLRTFSTVMGDNANEFQGLAKLFNAAMWTIFQVFKIVAVLIMTIMTAILAVWTGILEAIHAVVKALGFSKAAQSIQDTIDANNENMEQMVTGMSDLMDMSFDDAKALHEHEEATKDSTDAINEMTESLTNVPQGYKVALTRFQSAARDMAEAAEEAASTGGAGGGRNGGRNGDPTFYSNKEGTSSDPRSSKPSTARGSGPSTARSRGAAPDSPVEPTIYIENLIVQANDIFELRKQLEAVGNRRSLVSTGRLTTSVGPKFSTGGG